MANDDEGLRRLITVSKNGQFRVTIPKHVGQMFKLKNGTPVEFETGRDEIIMKIVR